MAGTAKISINVLSGAKYSIVVVPGRSTLVNTEPNPRTVAGVFVPGTKNSTSTTLLPSGVNSRCALKAANVEG